ncbi:uncharacterized protein L201_006655 [Kwoniella dendrophila CBS 6074]|uniref:Ribosomal protein S11 n=1 Tax=Kwoniella dendrophila CBS 6074 TaxID=1295534 RepID=A0AAX4K2V9_9TREE
MASVIKSTIQNTPRLSRPFFYPQAGFASSSRHGLDFTRPRSLPSPTTTTTTTTLEPETVAPPQETPFTSTSTPESIPTPQAQPQPKTPPTVSTPQPKLVTPTIPTTPLRIQNQTQTQSSKKGAVGYRWVPEKNLSLSSTSSYNSGREVDTYPTHTLNIRSTRNNVVLSFTDGLGPLFSTISGGSDGSFKNSQRSSYEAATQASIKMFEKILDFYQTTSIPRSSKSQRFNLRVSFNGLFGQGREAISSALSGPEGQEIRTLIRRVEDKTKVKIGGTRAPKPRRL